MDSRELLPSAPAPACEHVAALREELRQKTESHRLAATEAEKLRADLASARAENKQFRDEIAELRRDSAVMYRHWLNQQTRRESAEARVRDLEAKIVAIEAWGRRWIAVNGSHPMWSAFDAALGKEQPNG